MSVEVTSTEGQTHTIMLDEALYMPSCDHAGIISVKRGLTSGHEFHFQGDHSYMVSGRIRIPLLEKKKLYYVNAVKPQTVVRRSALEWHDIMGHLNFQSIYKMPKMVAGMEITHKNKRHCVTCLKGKAKQSLNKNPDQKSDSPFAFVHSDISGPRNVEDTTNNHNYIAVFVCDYSGYMVVFTMEYKSDIVMAFQMFLQYAARFGKVTRIRTDKEQVYTSNAFEEICRKNQIFHETSARKTPSQNGTAERAFGTLHPHVRCLLLQSNLPQKLWPQAYKYAAYLYNRSPIKRIGCTPFQLVYGYKPNVSKLLKFGTPVHTLNMEPKSKLDSRTIPGIFVGFDPKSSAPLIWHEDEDLLRESARIFPIPEPAEQEAGVNTPTADLDQGILSGDSSTSANSPVTTPTSTKIRKHQSSPSCEVQNAPAMSDAPSTPTRSPTDLDDGENFSSPISRQRRRRKRRRRKSHKSKSSSSPGCMNSPGGSSSSKLKTSGMVSPSCKSSLNRSSSSRPPKNDKSEKSVVQNKKNVDLNTRPQRKRKPPERYGDNISIESVFNVTLFEHCYKVYSAPKNYKDAINSPDGVKWQLAMDREYNSLMEHGTFILVDRPKDHDVITGRWVFSIKDVLPPLFREKARWVARGFLQKYGETFTDTFAPMSRMTTIRVLMLLCIFHGFICHQLDIETAFLNADLDHDVYIEQPPGYCKDKSKVCLLRKSLYGLKQSAKLWNENVHNFLENNGFARTHADMCLYRKENSQGIIFLIIWVDDIVILSNNIKLIDNFKEQISNKYKVKDLGPLKSFLGIEFNVTSESVHMSQSGYCKTILERFGMTDCNPMKIPCEKNVHDELRVHRDSPVLENPTRYRELVGSLIYLQQVTRPDISFITNLLGQYMSTPTQFTWELGLKTLRYLKGTTNYSLNYYKSDILQLKGFSDADWGNAPDRKSQSGYCFFLADNSSPVSWTSRKQKLVATSTCNSEYIALSESVAECIWLQQLLADINLKGIHSRPAHMYCDNNSAIDLSKNACHHRRSKHIDIKWHHIRDHITQETITLTHVPSIDNVADGFTKALAYPLFSKFKNNMLNNI